MKINLTKPKYSETFKIYLLLVMNYIMLVRVPYKWLYEKKDKQLIYKLV